jgi:hypothetical protein
VLNNGKAVITKSGMKNIQWGWNIKLGMIYLGRSRTDMIGRTILFG